jgi:hypothetical protein
MNIMQLAAQSQALKPKYEQEIVPVTILQTRPAPKLTWVDDDGHEHTKQNVLFQLEDGTKLEFPIMSERIVDNGAMIIGSKSYATISKRIVKNDTKNYKKGDEIASLDRIEVLIGGDIAMLAKSGAILNINNKN